MLKALSVRVGKAICGGAALFGVWLAPTAALAGGQCPSADGSACVAIGAPTRTPGGSPVCDPTPRPAEFDPTGINYCDCANDLTLTFPLAVTDPPAADHLEVWVGPPVGDCLNPAARAKGGGCWPVSSSISTSATSVSVRAQDIAAYLNNPSPPTTYAAVNSTSTACQAQTTPGPVNLGIYFILVASSDAAVDGIPGEYTPFEVATLGPYAPSGVSLVVSDGYGSVAWTPPTSASSIYGYYVYCQNFGAVDAATVNADTGTTTGDEGINTEDGGLAGNQCKKNSLGYVYLGQNSATPDASTPADAADVDSSATLVNEAGVVITNPTTSDGISLINLSSTVTLCASPFDALDGSMTSGSTASSANINLTNYDYYVVGVAAVDTLGNVGPVGTIQCGVPGPLADFWYDYTTVDGGLAGGGFCALDAVGMPAGSAVMGLGVGFIAIGMVRRRRRARR